MSSIDSNFLTSKISSSSLDLSNAQKTLESAKDGLFDLSSITSGGDSFISTTDAAGATTGTSQSQLPNTTDSNGNFVATGSYASQIQQYQQYISQLEQQIQEYEQQIQQYNTQLEAEKAELEATNQKIAATEQELQNYENQKAAKEAQYENVLAQIDQAEANNEDGGQDVVINSLTSKLNTLSTEITLLGINISSKSAELETYKEQASASQATIADLEEKISSTETLKTTAELQKTDAQEKLCAAQEAKAAEDAAKAAAAKAAAEAAKKAAECESDSDDSDSSTSSSSSSSTSNKTVDGNSIMSMVSDEEKAIIEEEGIDLTEKNSDGSAKYIIAQGGTSSTDYHVYEVDSSGNGSSLARKYAEDEGYDIVEEGYGNIYDASNEDYDDCYYAEREVYNVTGVCEDTGDVTMECSTKDYATASPLSFDLEGDGVKTSDELIRYDIDGDGDLDTINDSADAILVFDADGDGISGEDGSECFGDNTDLDGDGKADGYKDGFEALKALADQEGLVDGVYDTTLDEEDLKVLEEKYGLQIKTDGYNSEGSSLFEAGITEINLATTDETTLHKNFDGKQNDLMTQEGATFVVNGEEREYADIWHAKKDE